MNKKVIILGILVIIWMGFIFLMSEMDATSSEDNSQTIIVNIIKQYDKITNAKPEIVLKHQKKEFIENANHLFRKICHAGVYLVLSVLLLCFLIELKKFSLINCLFINIIICFLYACSDEYHQTFVSGRAGQFSDVIIDCFGALIGMIVILLFYKMLFNKMTKSVKN